MWLVFIMEAAASLEEVPPSFNSATSAHKCSTTSSSNSVLPRARLLVILAASKTKQRTFLDFHLSIPRALLVKHTHPKTISSFKSEASGTSVVLKRVMGHRALEPRPCSSQRRLS